MKINIVLIKKILKDLPLIPLYYLSLLIPKNKNLWIFQSWDTNSFIDNGKYFYLYCHQKPIDIFFISKNKYVVKKLNLEGYNSEYIWSIKGIWKMLRAKEYIIDNSFIGPGLWLGAGARKTQLWHGTGIKKIGYNLHSPKKEALMAFYKKFIIPWKGYSKEDLFIVPSAHYADMINKGLRTNRKNTLNLGFSRNDYISREIKGRYIFDKDEVMRIKKLKNSGAKTILYVPSWGHKDNDMVKILNLKKTIRLLKKTNSYLLTKAHKIGEKMNNLNSKHIIELPKNLDIYNILKDIDILITDYSSASCDFLFLNRPIIFYPYDFEWYKNNINPFHYDFFQHSPGPIAKTPSDFFKILEETLKGKDDFEKERKKELNFWFDYKDGKASERIYDYIKKTQ